MADRIISPEKLREHRTERRWSQRELADRAGVSERTIRYAEAGTSRTQGLALRALAAALELSIDDITDPVSAPAGTR